MQNLAHFHSHLPISSHEGMDGSGTYLVFVVILYYVKATHMHTFIIFWLIIDMLILHFVPHVLITLLTLAFLFRIWISILVMVSRQRCLNIGWMSTRHQGAKISVHLNRGCFSPFVS